ncbi:MAG TPA: L,D-transpeptidase family protein [Xanthobacteraceae bacterium]
MRTRSIRLRAASFRARATGRVAYVTLVALATTLTALSAAPLANPGPRQARPAPTTEAAAPREAGEPIMAIVSIKGQQVTFYDADGWILRAPVSTGTTGRETPAGVFAVVEKDKDHHSSLYDDAWMPNMQRITWSGVALHGGPLPGYAASHGCIRMPYDFAEKLFDKTRIGMRVIISPANTEPVEFSDPSLFVPKQEAIDAAPARADALAGAAEEATKAAAAAKTALATAKREAAAAPIAVRKLAYLKSRAEAELAYANRALSAARANEARAEDIKERATAKVAELGTQPLPPTGRADAELAYAERALEAAKTSEAKTEDAEQKAAAKAEELRTQLEAAKAEQKTNQDAIADAVALVKTTQAKQIEAAKAAKDAKLALEPVSIFISRATRKLYVRRNTHKQEPDGGDRFDTTIEVPVTIDEPGKPIGTHIFTAVARTKDGLRWTAVTIDNGDNAKDALDRITFPQEVLDRIAPTTLPRSSIIISDEPPNRETNYRTEFVVVLNNQPQGGLAMRKPPADTEPGLGNGWDNGFFSFNRWRDWNSQNGAAPQRRGQSYYPGQPGSW